MRSSESSAASDSPTPKSQFQSWFPTLLWLLSWRGGIRIALFAIVCLATIVGLFHAEENIRGNHAWKKYRAELITKGQWIDFNKLIPPRVPDDQNFAMTPRLAALFDYVPGTHQLRDPEAFGKAIPDRLTHFQPSTQKTPDWMTNRFTDFIDCIGLMQEYAASKKSSVTARQQASDTRSENGGETATKNPGTQAEAASMVLAEIAKEQALFDEISAATKRPYSRFNLSYEREDKFGILLPHLASIKFYCKTFSLKASAELLLGSPGAAFEDVNTAMKISETVKSEPILISYLVRCACQNLYLQPIWEGLARHQWSAEQIASFQQCLENANLQQQAQLAIKGDLWMGDSFCDLWNSRPSYAVGAFDDFPSISGPESVSSDLILRVLIPKGWIALERVNFNQLFREKIEPHFSSEIMNPAVIAENTNAFAAAVGADFDRIWKHKVLAASLLPSLGRFAKRHAQAQATANLAVVAFAIERYRMANGHVPEKLELLAPTFLQKVPRDVIKGDSLKYRVSDNGHFILYSLGWNAADDGGSQIYDKELASLRDWVWQYPVSVSVN